MLTAEWYFCLHSIGILNLGWFGNSPIPLEAVQVPYVQPAEKISIITEYKCIKGNHARNLRSDSANPDKCLASFSANSSDSFCDMHFISLRFCRVHDLSFNPSIFLLVAWAAWSQFFYWHRPPILKAVEQVWEANRLRFSAFVALMHEQTCLSCFRQFRATEIFFTIDTWTTELYFCLHSIGILNMIGLQNVLKIRLLAPPILLKPAHGSELLGYNVAVDVR